METDCPWDSKVRHPVYTLSNQKSQLALEYPFEGTRETVRRANLNTERLSTENREAHDPNLQELGATIRLSRFRGKPKKMAERNRPCL